MREYLGRGISPEGLQLRPQRPPLAGRWFHVRHAGGGLGEHIYQVPRHRHREKLRSATRMDDVGYIDGAERPPIEVWGDVEQTMGAFAAGVSSVTFRTEVQDM